ncbi:MAG: polysaccharide deacetylase family protein [Chitinophagaceae bacterium]
MDLPDAAGDATASRTAILINPYYLLATLIVLVLVSCTEKKEKPLPAKPAAPDSSLVRKQPRADSLARPAAKKKLYFTFDDGPNAGTMHVLEAVTTIQVPASFFIVAKHTTDSREQHTTWEKLKSTPGIELCNHSYSHASNHYSRFYRDPQNVIADLNRSNDSLHFQNKVARMPGRNAWRIGNNIHTDVKESKAAIDSVGQAGYSVMGWDVEWGYNHTSLVPDADTSLMFRRIQNLLNDSATRTPGHLVLLAHDQSFRREEDIRLLEAVLAHFKNDPEYELRLVSQYPGVNN